MFGQALQERAIEDSSTEVETDCGGQLIAMTSANSHVATPSGRLRLPADWRHFCIAREHAIRVVTPRSYGLGVSICVGKNDTSLLAKLSGVLIALC